MERKSRAPSLQCSEVLQFGANVGASIEQSFGLFDGIVTIRP